jgi:hypothetical protein
MDSTVLACMGIGAECLTTECLDDLAEIAEGVHDRAAWSAPYDPHRLAESEGVGLTIASMDALLLDRALYRATDDRRDDGLLIARAIAGVLLLRAGRYSELRAWALAAELLVPEWALDATHLHAPVWLLSMRGRLLRAA